MKQPSSWSTPTLYGAFVLSGAVTYLLGAMIPDLRLRWGLPYSTLATLAPVQFTAGALGSLLSSWNLRRSVVLGYALIAIGLCGVGLGWPAALLAMAFVGFGLGLSIPATNVLVAQMNPQRRGAALNALNALWGVGAISCQFLFFVLARRASTEAASWLLAMVAAVTWLVASRSLARTTLPSGPAGRGSRASVPVIVLLLLTGQLFLYNGTESSVANWLVALCVETDPRRSPLSYLVAAGFWAALIGGRAVSSLLLRRLSERALYAASLVVAAVGVLLLLSARTLAATTLGAVVVGLGLAPLFALVASLIVARTEGAHARLAGALFASGSLGAGALPWVMGQMAGGTSVRLAFFIPLGAIAGMALLFRRNRPEPAASSPAPMGEPAPTD